MAWRKWSSVVPLLILLCNGTQSQLDVCGIVPLKTKIVGGEDAPPGSWPWQVSVQNFDSHLCGGSLINKEWVMSAAHCFSSSNTFGWTVSLGRQSLLGTNPNEVSKSVARILLHPDYDSSTSDNDIALLQLSTPVTFTDYIRPVCLAASGSEFNNGTDSWVTGWGAVQEGVSLPFPETLQEVEVPVLGNRQCDCLNGVGTITENMICAGVLEGGKDSCQGDSGGPMVSQKDSKWVQSGVVSFGFGCARPNLPGVYSRVSRYQSWINSHIKSDRPGFVRFTSSGPDADSSYTCPGLPPVVTVSPPSTTGSLTDSSQQQTTTSTPSTGTSAELCGITPIKTKIVGGEDAPPGSWPWQVSVQNFDSHLCGGSLINKEWVMSAAHCFSSSNTFGWTVSLGRQSLLGTNPNEVSKSVARILLHPDYDSSTSDNDIALLQLSTPVTFTDYIRPVCLAASGSEFNNGTDSWVTGWGAVQEGVSLPFPETLQEVEVPVLGNRQCDCLNGVGTITENMICAGVLEGGKDSCQGDSGGPMVSQKDSKWVQSGVVSFGFGCARPNLPGVYSRVSRYQSWINSHIKSDRPGFVRFTSSGPDADSSYTCPGLPPVSATASTTSSTLGSLILPSTSTLAGPPNVLSSVCGKAPLNTRAVGDSGNVPEGFWPWVVNLKKNGVYVCAGSLIAENFIITSAQCFPSSFPDVSEWTVYVGRRLSSSSQDFELSLSVANITLTNLPSSNIALIQLTTPVSFSDYVQPLCVDINDDQNFLAGTECWVAGWSTESRRRRSLKVGSVLQDVETQVADCVESSASDSICTYSMELHQGHEGSPLLCKSQSSWFQAAVVTLSGNKSPRVDIQVFAKTSRFASVLKAVVGAMPSPAATSNGFSLVFSSCLLLIPCMFSLL